MADHPAPVAGISDRARPSRGVTATLRFRRRLPILRGLTVNLGKSGVTSVSLGVRGAHLTLGRYGRRATVGLPGSGLFYSVYEKHYRQPSHASPGLAVAVVILAALLAIAVIFAAR
jgi:hypothetical protein